MTRAPEPRPLPPDADGDLPDLSPATGHGS